MVLGVEVFGVVDYIQTYIHHLELRRLFLLGSIFSVLYCQNYDDRIDYHCNIV